VIKPDDLVLLSDLDEIPCPDAIIKALPSLTDDIYTFCQGWYMYYFNVMSDKEWFGSRLMKFSQLQGNSFDLMRHHLEDRHLQPGPIIENGGWHFSFLGGEKRVLEKLQAYSYQGRKSRYLLKFLDKFFSNRIGRKIKNNEDIFNTGRAFETVVLNDRFPSYLIDNRNKYEALIKHDIC
jgi:beta-1,4-mannosyl-glycoprotein beta-1,4-N-acetylglucosaminyltransferase